MRTIENDSASQPRLPDIPLRQVFDTVLHEYVDPGRVVDRLTINRATDALYMCRVEYVDSEELEGGPINVE